MKLQLGDVSPLAGMMTGKGLTGELAAKGGFGLLPAVFARDAQKEEEEKRKRQASGMSSMKKGGKVSSASKRADGCAIKGKTRGKMV